VNSKYKNTVDWMFAQLPMYQQQGVSAYKPDLSNVTMLANYLGNPERLLKCVHVAGTNGKGSTSHMLASILQEAGYKTGLFTSPHLKDFRERVRINGEMISQDYVVDFIDSHKPFFESHQLSFFEMSAGLAFNYFADNRVDIAIIETGLGGRLDATNIITPIVSVITNIGLDHVNLLGDTLEKIAGEKAGIIKEGIPVVIGEYTQDTETVFTDKANITHSRIIFASENAYSEYESDLKGSYQRSNRKTVLATIEELRNAGFLISEDNIANGLKNVSANTGLRGRWQQLGSQPLIIADTAHNSHGVGMVMKQVMQQTFKKLHIVFGVVADKDLDEILVLLPKTAEYYFAQPNIARGLDALALQRKASAFGLTGSVYASVCDAYKAACSTAGADDMIYVGGSTFVVAEIL
jgi:dihydrofolate synthase/folylpolyglutamate synthase